MATRVEKKYKTDSLVMMNKVLNYVNDYIGSKKKLAEPERQLTENVVTEIDYFLNKNGISDEVFRQAVERGK